MPTDLRYLICVFGPTAIGKTALSIDLAKWLNTEIISCDSRQFFKEMSIGTAKPAKEELAEVKHHFINSHSIEEEFSAGDFEKSILDLTERLFQNSQCIIMTGGSGLYLRAVTDGLPDMPEINSGIREELKDKLNHEGLESLLSELKSVDPEYFEEVDKDNPQRVVRGLEVYRATGKPFTTFRRQSVEERPFEILKIGLDMDRDKLYERINIRVDKMIEDGLLDEVKNLQPYRNKQALQTVGYKEVFSYLDGEHDLETAIELIKRNTRRYAKRQLTWFRKEEDVQWFHPGDLAGIKEFIESRINN
ncbi:tRNA (adenosine(37)-N6)-dimethylallyltransferase MiaA [Fulvivirga lutea]|uniref:tRNA dimethylallyltransferase n=1 Tax=Fulvivirga lutea TaxID=2810512 RepID=A0A975A069_9BACT|nr:tRNA (adenosine(37)-N6)-dimethylallyltransferase MiaA [Fulvivirga lutea]QSE96936.1 tRNA (adenosine(37)-N6)-dimethylallyltransferase MiaA [Fulvivirga lutea]